ncbi:MAG: sterol desaturase family protein [Leptospira sp.]|nr:sterol desaturase family protein [Leptospira sp.]
MDLIIKYFETIPSWHRSLILFGGFTFFWFLEARFAPFISDRLSHARVNIFFWITTLVINLIFAGTILKASLIAEENNFGLLNQIELPLWAELLIAILLLDALAVFLPHWIQHKIPFLWKFHVIHHSDPIVDVTTGLRHHPIEGLLRVVFTVAFVFLLGVPIGFLMLYQTLSGLFAQIIHANIRIQPKLERLLSFVFVTPSLHRVHHHHKLPYTDTNYGNIFSLWDRLFGMAVHLNREEIHYGVDSLPHSAERESSAFQLLTAPFRIRIIKN